MCRCGIFLIFIYRFLGFVRTAIFAQFCVICKRYDDYFCDKKQWERAGFDISNRPEILFTLFNIGFSESHPSANPQCGGSHITVGDHIYTFGAIGFDFYYSGELAKEFPYNEKRFED